MHESDPENQDVSKAKLEELSLLLEDRSFVDYFNIFLCLPVFGQHVYYNFMDSEFDFEPPIKQRRDLFLDKREVLLWLCKERFSLFKSTPLSTEYSLCSKLRTASVGLSGVKTRDETDNGEDSSTLIKNVMGTALGMLMFRESIRGTCGETVYRCWRDIEAWRRLEDGVRRMYWKHAIKNKYIHQDSASELKGRVKMLVFQGVLNFDLIPEDQVEKHIWQGLEADPEISEVESDDALLQLQIVLLDAMKKYWVPRFILHLRQTASEETMATLAKPVPGDLEYLSQERHLRCRFMFPTIYQQETTLSTPTSVFVSQSSGEIPASPESLGFSSAEDEDFPFEDEVNPTTLFNLWTGPAKDIAVEDSSSFSGSASSESIEKSSPDVYGNQRVQSRNISTNKIPRSPVPIVLLSYLGGKKRTILGKFPSTGNRVSWSLASDALAGSPFRSFLFQREHMTDLQYLSFWTDVRNYLDSDEHAVDGYGFPLKRLLAHNFMEKYLSQSGPGSHLFSESLKNSLFNALGNANDVSLLCMAQDIVLENLWEPLKLYIQDERQHFLKQVRGYRYNMNPKLRKTRNQLQDFNSVLTSTSNDVDPMYFFQCTTIRRESVSDTSSPGFDTTLPAQSATESRAPTSYRISITEEQMWKAMELTVLCSEYGVSMMVPQYLPKPEQLIDVLHGDYGSLYVTRVPAVRNEWLRNLIFPPKINIKTIRVSRKVNLEKVDLSELAKRDEKEERTGRTNRLVLRRNGMILERPNKPKTFIEVLTTQGHFDFFKRFMMVHKATMPLLFWKAVEELKDLSNTKTRMIRVTQIMRKFFGKHAKYGALLDCHEDIIRQIPNMEKVTPGILICAQAAVFRSMERKWYPLYLDTYPPESDSGHGSRTTIIQPRTITPDLKDVVYVAKKPLKKKMQSARKTILLWRTLSRGLVEFWKAMTNHTETQLLEMFLKCEIEKEQQNAKPALDTAVEKSIMMSSMAANLQQTRVVIRNRLIILNRLPSDLRFWLEVQKYLNLIDGTSATGDKELLNDKARSIVSCFLASDVPPRIQVNIPNDLAATIINNLAQNGPQRGLFHDAIFLLFPALNHFWKRYTEEWIAGDLPDSYLDYIERTMINRVSDTPHQQSVEKDYTSLKTDEIKAVSQIMIDDTMVRIHFSIAEGVTIFYPQPKTQPKPSETGRRMTKPSIFSRSNASFSPRKEKESKMQLHAGDKKEVKQTTKHKGEKQKEEEGKEKEKLKKKEKKIVVKDPSESHDSTSQSPRQSQVSLPRRLSTDRAQRLSQLVETLNNEREQRIKSQNQKFSQKLMRFDEVVSAAMQEISDSGSMFS